KLAREFPPLRSVLRPGNLPHVMSSLVGRGRQMAELAEALCREQLVTLSGTGGVGKTRLALEVAHNVAGDFGDGVWFCDLSSADERSVTASVARDIGVVDRPGWDELTLLVEAARGKQMLLVLDNCEHVIDTCAQLVMAITRAAPTVRILTTSREELRVSGEH